ncbi:MAG TPA: adenylate/guanylate cyclase domain-containing protein [Spirochaetota bacterium]|nr:adenylate/guanylate cyclase domain-containing protein [Spirochaetota bacterium]
MEKKQTKAYLGLLLTGFSFFALNSGSLLLFLKYYSTVMSMQEYDELRERFFDELMLLPASTLFLYLAFAFYVVFAGYRIINEAKDASTVILVKKMSQLPSLCVRLTLFIWLGFTCVTGWLLWSFDSQFLLTGRVLLFWSVLSMVVVSVLYYASFYINSVMILPCIRVGVPPLFDGLYKIRLTLTVKFMLFFAAIALVPLMFLLFLYASLTIQFGRYDLYLNIVVMGVFLTVIPLILSFTFSRSIALPLRKLRKAARDLSKGEYDSPVSIYSGDELGQLSCTINHAAMELKEGQRVKESFGIMVDPVIRDHVLKGNLELGGELKFATVLYTDIRNFTGMSENFPPDFIVEVINSYFDRMSECVTLEHGIVNKFIGDALLAVFGEPVIMEDPVDAALRAAIVMRKDLRLLNESLTERRLPVVDAGLGIHTGDVLAGNIGSKRRMEYTVIGDAVNVATRIEKLTKIYRVPVVISESSYYFLMHKELFNIREIDNVRVKGKQEPVRIFEVFDCDNNEVKKKKIKSLMVFNQAVQFYRDGEFNRALKRFNEICRYNEHDTVSSMYVSRCRRLGSKKMKAWDGVSVYGA